MHTLQGKSIQTSVPWSWAPNSRQLSFASGLLLDKLKGSIRKRGRRRFPKFNRIIEFLKVVILWGNSKRVIRLQSFVLSGAFVLICRCIVAGDGVNVPNWSYYRDVCLSFRLIEINRSSRKFNATLLFQALLFDKDVLFLGVSTLSSVEGIVGTEQFWELCGRKKLSKLHSPGWAVKKV